MIRFLLLASLASSCWGSTVVVWLTTEGIVAAADSLEQSGDLPSSLDEEQVCKIQSLGGYFFASTGYTRIRLGGATKQVLYSVREVAQTIAQQSTGIDDFTSKYVEVMKQKLADAMTASLRMDRRYFMGEINGKGGALASTVFGIEDGQPKISLISFTPTAVNSAVKVQESVQRCPGEGCDFVRGVFGQLGIRDFMGPKLEPNPKTLEEAVPWAASLIQTEIDGDRDRSLRQKTTRRVGSPVVVLTIRPDGARWSEDHQGNCPTLGN